MKKLIIIISITISPLFWRGGDGEAFSQNYVTIPDANFATYLQATIPSAMSGSLMDTSSTLVITFGDTMKIASKNIANLTGIQYFKSLKVLYADNNQLTFLPTLPNSLKLLDCWNNQLTSLPTLPDSLQILQCVSNPLHSIPVLPNSLQRLACGNDSLTSLPVLPNSLKFLWCSYNNLTNLPTLSDSLITLIADNNELTNLPTLPSKLNYLGCFNNKLTSLPDLPNSIKDIECYNNQLTSLPTLPDSLTRLVCSNNKITCFPTFPNTLTAHNGVIISGNPYTCLPNYVSGMVNAAATPLCNVDNPNGCPVSKDAPTQIIIPNIFTPNGDNINDEFFIKASNLTNFSCKIYDRWGSLVYQWTDINGSWNAKDKSDGTYYYVITYTDSAGKPDNKNGFFQLIR